MMVNPGMKFIKLYAQEALPVSPRGQDSPTVMPVCTQ